MGEVHCQNCGWESTLPVRFCGQCGARIGPVTDAGGKAGDEAGKATPRVEGPPRPAVPAGQPVLEPGTIIGERYELRGILGRGGMGAVMLAWDRLVGEEVAIKFMHPFFVHGEEGVKRFLREGRLARRLNHPNIVRTMNIESHAGLTCIVMEPGLRGARHAG